MHFPGALLGDPFSLMLSLYPHYNTSRKDINISYIKMLLTFTSSLIQQPLGCSFMTSSSISCPWKSTSAVPSLPCMEKSRLHGWKLMLEENFLKDQLSTTFPLLCWCSGEGRKQKRDLPSLVFNQLLVNLYPWSHNPSGMMATKESQMLPGACRKQRGPQLCISWACACHWLWWADSQEFHTEPTALPLSDFNEASPFNEAHPLFLIAL